MIKTQQRMIKLNFNMIILFIAQEGYKLLLSDKISDFSFKCKQEHESLARKVQVMSLFCQF